MTNQQNSRTENIQPSNNVAEEEVVDHHLNKYEPTLRPGSSMLLEFEKKNSTGRLIETFSKYPDQVV